MILRRVMEHLRKQEWTAIGIDFVIVVVGVFVGIQVANWNSDAVDRRRGVEYVERLSRDLEADLAARRADVAYYAAVQDSLVRANDLLNQPSSDAEDLVVAAYRASELMYSPPTRATWDEIVSAGDIGLLPRGAVESGIASYFAADTGQMSMESMERSEYRRAVRETIPLEIQIALRGGCSDVRDDHGELSGSSSIARWTSIARRWSGRRRQSAQAKRSVARCAISIPMSIRRAPISMPT